MPRSARSVSNLPYSFNFVYKLIDPRYSEPDSELIGVRYIGVTVDPNRRYSAHLSCPSADPPKKNAWVREVQAAGLQPEMDILEVFKVQGTIEVMKETAREHESYWIKYYRDLGADLLNTQINNKAWDWLDNWLDELMSLPNFNGALLGGEPD